MANSSPALTIASVADSGLQTLSWVVTDAPEGTLKMIKSIVNETSASTAIKETIHQILDAEGNQISSIVMDDTYLPLGKQAFVRLEFTYSNQTKVLSNILLLSNKKVPNTPVLALGSSIRSEDSGVSINLSQFGLVNSPNDGYSAITSAVVFVSKVGGTSANDFQMVEVPISTYAEWVLVNTPVGLVNDLQYEIALKVRNNVGDSSLSNTLTFSPKDTPAQVGNVAVYSLLSDQQRKSQILNDANGDIVVYWPKPSDYDNLITNNRRVLKYIIKEQEFEDVVVITNGVSSTVTQERGAARVIELSVPSHLIGANSGASFELATAETIGAATFQYKYIIAGSADRLGKKYKYDVTANNVNGDGPSSAVSGMVYSFKAANAQQFELIHTSSESNVTATPLVLYDGKMTMRINAGTLSSLNGGLGYSVPNTSFSYPVGYNVPNDEQLALKIMKESDSSLIYEGLVKFVQKVTSVTTGTGVNAVTVYTATGEFNFDFDNLDVDTVTPGLQSLNAALQLGTKYRFQVYRQNQDPAILANTFKSLSTDILRTKFMSPSAVSKLMSYAINDDLTPVTSGASPAIRLLFNQLSNAELNGLDVFNSEIRYFAYQQSLPVANLAPIIHNPLANGSKEFIIPQLSTGSQVAQYIRSDTFNPELNLRISGVETAPAVTETAFTYPAAITAVTINKLSATTATIGFTRQAANSLGGSLSADIQNRILVFEDGVSTPIQNIVVAHAVATNYVSPTLTFTNGKTYGVFVSSERVYSKAAHDVVGSRFANVIVRNNYFTENFVMNGTPGAPTNIELLPSNKTVNVLYDEPSNLNGVPAASLQYHFFMNSDFTDFPLFTTSPQVFQASVADVAGSSIATITKAYTSKSSSNLRANAIDLINDTEYKFAMRVNGTIGGNSLTQTAYSQVVSTGLVNGSVYNASLALVAAPVVPVTTVNGVMSTVVSVIVADSVPTPAGVTIGAAANVLNVEFLKDLSSSVNDVLIVLDNNDALGVGDVAAPAFDTRSLRNQDSNSGLFNLETWATAGASVVAANAPAFSRYNFQRVNVSGVFKYQLTIPDLVNGRSYSVSIRFIKNLNGSDVFGPAVTVVRAPEAPPTPVQNVTFSVASQAINLGWLAPSNSGGASIGSNGALKYRIQLLSALDVLLGSFETSNLSFQISSNLVDGTNYKVTIAALYTKGSDNSDVISTLVQANAAAGNLIKPGAAPVGPTLAVTVGTSNTIGGSIVLPASVEMNSYPVTRYDVYVRQKSTPLNRVLVQSFASSSGSHPHGLAYTVNALAAGSTITLSAINAFPTSGVTPNTIGHARPLNGFTYEVFVETIANYTFAQAASTKVADASPYGNVSITGAAWKPGSNKQIYTVTANLNGSGAISNVVALAKGANSKAILVSNLSGVTLPTIASSGALDNASLFVAAGQIATFDLPFTGAAGDVNDLLAVVVTQNGSDTIVVPASLGFFS